VSDPCAIPRIVIAGAASGVGKTTITTGLIAALAQRGLTVQPFKCGPDYIDPSYHARAARRPCRNLDTWMLEDGQLVEAFCRACRHADLAVIEGVMGLFDGSDWHGERGSTAQIAKLLGAPVLLVADVSGAARSAAIPVLGCQHFDSELALCAVALNFAGSEGHARGCSEAIRRCTGLPVLGWLPRDGRLQIPERHLGLTPGGEQADTEPLIAAIAAQVTERFDLSALLELARSAPVLRVPVRGELPAGGASAQRARTSAGDAPAGRAAAVEAVAPAARASAPVDRTAAPVLAVARDAAFCFYYPENLELLTEAGARIEFFSPVRGEYPSVRASGVYLGGGYPELHGRELAANTQLWRWLHDLRAQGGPIYAECGGFMVLAERLVDLEGREWPMAGLIPGSVRMSRKLAALGYRVVTAVRDNLVAAAGRTLRGHEFRYSSWEVAEETAARVAAWRARNARGDASELTGYADESVLASYVHLHFAQDPAIAAALVERLHGRVTSTDSVSGHPD
jgi:cobyrinic acid a,c-diamide synthase